MKKCSNCKVDNPDEAKFCRKCGKPLGKAPSPFIKKFKDKRVILAGTALALAISGGVGIALYNNTPERQYQKNIEMANKYLNEYNFAKAEEYLNVAKSIDPKKEKAYEDLVTVYKAQSKTAQADTVISEAKKTLPTSEQSSFLAQLESLTNRANSLVEASLEAQKVNDTKISSSNAASSVRVSTQNEISSKTDSGSQSSSEIQGSEISVTGPKDAGAVAIAERPVIDPNDLIDDIDGQSVTISLEDTNSDTASIASEKEADKKDSKDVVPPALQKDTPNTSKDSIEPSINSEIQVISPLPNTPYTPVSEIGSLDMVPIALNSDCWVIKKGNEFQFLFPDGSTKNLDSKDQLILQANINHTGNTTLLSSACLIESSNKSHNQYYPKEEEVSSCLSNGSEKTSYPLEGNYQNSITPVLVRSSNQNGYWIYNPASKALYGPFKDSEDTSFYSKVSHLSDITLVGHNGQIGGPYWTPAGSTVQETTKNEKLQSFTSDLKDPDSELISKESKASDNSKDSTAVSQTNTNTEELKIWSKDGTSYKTGYTNPKAVDWYTVGAFQADQFHLLNENLEIVYVGPFDQGGSVIKGVAPVQINGVWKLVQFKNVPSNGPATNYSFTNTDKEKSETSSDTSTSDQEKKSTDEAKSDSSTSTSSTTKVNTSEKSTTQSNEITTEVNDKIKTENSSTQSTSKDNPNYFLKDEDASSTSSNISKVKEDEKVTSETSSTKSIISDTKSSSTSEKRDNYFLKDEDINSTSSNKTETNTTKAKEDEKAASETTSTKSKNSDTKSSSNSSTSKESDKTTSENSSTQSSSNKNSNTTSTNKTGTSSINKEDVNYFDKSSKNTTDKTVTNDTNDKEDQSSNKASTSVTSKSSTNPATQKDKVTISTSTLKDEVDETTSTLSSDDAKGNNKDDEDTSDEVSTPIYYSFPEFAGTYTVTGADWSNSFKLYKDGSFEGEYTEVSEDGDPELYPNGVISICSYSGTFSLKKNRLTITSLSLEETPGESEIEDGILYKYLGLSESCMSKGEMFTLYGPGTPYSEFSSKASRWIPTPITDATVDFIMVQDGSSEYAYV